MEFFDYGIVKVISEERLNRVVRVRMIRDFYDGKKEVTVGFFLAEWEAYKSRGNYPEQRALDERGISYYENMPDSEWYKSRHDAKLKDFTDEEIVAEFNRRLDNTLFHKIGIESRAIIKEAR
ncbi:MAG: hypothetical protein K1W25_03130 [Lachnospiraceae bacterium]